MAEIEAAKVELCTRCGVARSIHPWTREQADAAKRWCWGLQGFATPAPVADAEPEREADADRMELLRGDDMRAAVRYLDRVRTLSDEDLSAVGALLMELAHWRSDDAAPPVAQATEPPCPQCNTTWTLEQVQLVHTVGTHIDGKFRSHERGGFVSSATEPPRNPVPMVLHCPECRTRHIDEGEFATKPHHTHACQGCGLTWRPAIVPTVGVQFLPGFKNDTEPRPEGDLKECPLGCQSEGIDVPKRFREYEMHTVQCADCGCSTGKYDTPERARASWNRRPAPPLDAQALAEDLNSIPWWEGIVAAARQPLPSDSEGAKQQWILACRALVSVRRIIERAAGRRS